MYIFRRKIKSERLREREVRIFVFGSLFGSLLVIKLSWGRGPGGVYLFVNYLVIIPTSMFKNLSSQTTDFLKNLSLPLTRCVTVQFSSPSKLTSGQSAFESQICLEYVLGRKKRCGYHEPEDHIH